MPSPSAIRTCQWETVLTHQIMAERKLLQGGDILPSQYGDVKCALGGGWGWRWGDPILEKAQITPALICASSLRREKGRHKYFHPFPSISPIFPPCAHARARGLSAIWPALSDVGVRRQSNFSFLPATETRRFFKFCRPSVSQLKGSRGALLMFLTLCLCNKDKLHTTFF